MEDERTYWLDGFEGRCKGGLFSRIDICKTIMQTEEFTNVKQVIGIKISKKESGNPDYTIEFIITEPEEEK